jgi:hypothetical protein
MLYQGNQFNNAVLLDNAHAETLLNFSGSLISGIFDASSFRSESSGLLLSHANLKSGLNVSFATASLIDLGAATCGGELNAVSLQISNDLYMLSDNGDKASFHNVILRGAKISHDIQMDGASFEAGWTQTDFKSAETCTCDRMAATRRTSRV